MDTKTYLGHYQRKWSELIQDQDEFCPQEYHQGLFTTWSLSYEQVRSESEPAAALLRLWAYLNREDMWFALMEGLRDQSQLFHRAHEDIRIDLHYLRHLAELADSEIKFNRALRLLSRYSLVDARESFSGHSIHPVLHEWSLHLTRGPEKIPLLYLAMSLIADLHTPERYITLDNWKFDKRCEIHAARAHHIRTGLQDGLDHIKYMEDTKIPGWILQIIGNIFYHAGKTDVAQNFHVAAIDLYERDLEHSRPLDVELALADVYRLEGKLEDAQNLLEKAALKVGANDLETIHPQAGDVMYHLGILYTDQMKLKEAEEMLGKALLVFEKEPKLGPRRLFDVMSRLGDIFCLLGKHDEAVLMYRRAIEGQESQFGLEDPDFLMSLAGLGRAQDNKGTVAEAEIVLLRAIEGWEKLGIDSIPALEPLFVLGCVRWRQGDLVKAEKTLAKAVVGYKRLRSSTLAVARTAAHVLSRVRAVLAFRDTLHEICEERGRTDLRQLLLCSSSIPPKSEGIHKLANALVVPEYIEGWYCDSCPQLKPPWTSIRFRCMQCKDFDFDEECFALDQNLRWDVGHDASHHFVAIEPSSGASKEVPALIQEIPPLTSMQYRQMLGLVLVEGVLRREVENTITGGKAE